MFFIVQFSATTWRSVGGSGLPHQNSKAEQIKRGKIRGEESNGMLCALQEIGFSDKIAPKAYEEGIWFYPCRSGSVP